MIPSNSRKGFFRFEALGDKEIKGKEKSVHIYRVIAPSTRRTRFDVSAERGLTPFVGRERELELLLDGFESSKEGRGQAISIVSEAGIGKSRLLYEFRKAVTNEDATFPGGDDASPTAGMSPIILWWTSLRPTLISRIPIRSRRSAKRLPKALNLL